MKADIFALLLVGLASVTVLKQKLPTGRTTPSDAERFADGQVATLDKKLHLSADQKASLRPIFLEKADQLVAVLNNTAIEEQQRGAAIQQLERETAAKVDALLTPQQRKQVPPAVRVA